MGINILLAESLVVGSLLLVGCGGGGTSDLSIVGASGAELSGGVAGDAIALKVVQASGDLPSGATVTWSGATLVTALSPTSTAASPLPLPGADPTAVFIDNPGRPDRNADLAGVLFILDPGKQSDPTLEITATVSGTVSGTATVAIPVSPVPAGDASQGGVVYAADCASCHGTAAAGTPAGPNGTFKIDGATYSYPAPGLNTASGNLGSDPDWNAPLLAMASRADMDNGGLTLRLPMPDWLATPDATTGKPLTTQDLVDVYAFVKTQSP